MNHSEKIIHSGTQAEVDAFEEASIDAQIAEAMQPGRYERDMDGHVVWVPDYEREHNTHAPEES